MMSGRTNTIPSGIDLWKRHEELYRSIFSKALTRLAQQNCEWGDEDQISEKLCHLLNIVCFELGRETNREVRTPDWEKPIPPITEEDLRGGKIRKRPDFTCCLFNPYTNDPETYQIPFHIECKRLGVASSSRWNLNENYVINGIKRFDCSIHEYGKRAISGMMIGYIISMEPTEIIKEVNSYITT